MKKKLALLLALVLTMTMLAASVGFAEETTVRIQVMNEFKGMDKVLEEYYARVADDPDLANIKLDFSYVGGGDYKDKINMLMTAKDENLDLVFVGSWHGLENFAKGGCLADLTAYFNNPDYPGLQKAFPPDYVEAAMTYLQDADGNWTKALYKIPLAQALEDMRGLVYREDMRVKYDIPEITSDEILKQYLDTVLANEPDFSFGWSMYMGFAYQFTPHFTAMKDNVYEFAVFGGDAEAPFYIALNEDGTKVLNAVTIGDDEAEFAKMPEGYQTDFIKAYRLAQLEWAEYLSPYRGTAEAEVGFALIAYDPLTTMPGRINDLKDNTDLLSIWPEASIRFYPAEQDQRETKPGAIVSPMVSNNFICVPSWSQNIDATMKFLDWMYQSQANHDLFELGVEGTHWEAIGENGYRQLFTDETDKYVMPGYSFTWNPTYVRYNETVLASEELTKYYDYQNSTEAYTPSALSGFAFNNEAVATEVATITAYASELQLRFALGGNATESQIANFNKKAVDAGLNTVRAELIKQVQAFLDMKNAVK